MTQTSEKRYQVCFRQVNQTCIGVSAATPERAIRKAARIWRRQNAEPDVISYEAVLANDEIES